MIPDVGSVENTDILTSYKASIIPGTVLFSKISVTSVVMPLTGPDLSVDGSANPDLPTAGSVCNEAP